VTREYRLARVKTLPGITLGQRTRAAADKSLMRKTTKTSRLLGLAAAGLMLLTAACAATASSSSQAVQPVEPRAIEPGAQAWETGSKPRVVLKQNLRKETYAVSGDSASELRADLDRKRPPSPDGRRFDANVLWSLTWSFHFDPSPGVCGLLNATVELQILVRLPVLAPDASPPDATRERWDSFALLLETHEAGHVDAYLEGARLLQDAFAGIQPAPSCDELRGELSALGTSAIEAIRAADVDYDRRTDHGRTQGATFP
jgi:predicted secreted Zn-dependent protease